MASGNGAFASSSKLPAEGEVLRVILGLSYQQAHTVIAQKSQKWIQMQRKRYGEKRRGGYVDMGKQVRVNVLSQSRILAYS